MNNSGAMILYFQLHLASIRRNPSIQHNSSVCCTSIKWKGLDHWRAFDPSRNSNCISRWSTSFGWKILSKSWQVSNLFIIECKNLDIQFYNVITYNFSMKYQFISAISILTLQTVHSNFVCQAIVINVKVINELMKYFLFLHKDSFYYAWTIMQCDILLINIVRACV